jgi:Outer membrane protein (porin)
MKRIALSTLSLALLGAAGAAHAQSSVTLYGLIDDSIQYVHNSNPNDGNLWQLAAGNLQGSRWGMKGTEDLGGGLKAIFQLESGFNPNNGKMGSYGTGTKLFGRQAYVGLTQDAYGTFTMGRQYDPLVDLVQPLTGDNFFGSTFTTPGDVDNNDNSSRTNNAIKYVSPVWGGFQVEGMYALGGVAGATGAGQSWAGAATWSGGPFSVAAGYFRMENGNTLASRGVTAATPSGVWNAGVTSDATFDGSNINGAYQSAKQIDITSAAGQFVTGPFTFNVRYSFAQYKPDAFSGFASQQKYQVVVLTQAGRSRRQCCSVWATPTRTALATRRQATTRFRWAATTICRSVPTCTWSVLTSTQAAISVIKLRARSSTQAHRLARMASGQVRTTRKWSVWVSVTSSNRTT